MAKCSNAGFGIGNPSFFGHSDLGTGRFLAASGSLKLFLTANVVFMLQAH
jgi:hypothetical protein